MSSGLPLPPAPRLTTMPQHSVLLHRHDWVALELAACCTPGTGHACEWGAVRQPAAGLTVPGPQRPGAQIWGSSPVTACARCAPLKGRAHLPPASRWYGLSSSMSAALPLEVGVSQLPSPLASASPVTLHRSGQHQGASEQLSSGGRSCQRSSTGRAAGKLRLGLTLHSLQRRGRRAGLLLHGAGLCSAAGFCRPRQLQQQHADRPFHSVVLLPGQSAVQRLRATHRLEWSECPPSASELASCHDVCDLQHMLELARAGALRCRWACQRRPLVAHRTPRSAA